MPQKMLFSPTPNTLAVAVLAAAAFKDGEGDSLKGSPISDCGSELVVGVGCGIFERIFAGGNCGSE